MSPVSIFLSKCCYANVQACIHRQTARNPYKKTTRSLLQPLTLSQMAEMTQSFSPFFLLIFISILLQLLLLNPITCSVSESETPKGQAERLIRSLNLFPKYDINAAIPTSAVITEKRVKLLGTSVQELGHHAGYYRLAHTKDARMFYFFFESRKNKKTDPVVIWLTGGPGCSSELAMFYENGPFHIANNLSLLSNPYGWDQASNIIFADQPTGTGFSYSGDEGDIRHNEQGVSDDLYDFLQAFFQHHPKYVNNPFYITGESYAGHYIPALASRIHHGNKVRQSGSILINIKGFAIGNGLTNPGIQYKAYPDYALSHNLINQSDYEKLNHLMPPCEHAIRLCGSNGGQSCAIGFSTCNAIFSHILAIAGNINYYDIRKKCKSNLCYDFSSMEKLLNQQTVKYALGVGEREFVSCSSEVYQAMIEDWMKNLEVGIPELLEDGIKLLVYAGEYDLICNWLGNLRWVNAMEWSGQKDFISAPSIPFKVDGVEAGELKGHGPLTFLKVYNAGHMVPMDQPKAALDMLRQWTQDKLQP